MKKNVSVVDSVQQNVHSVRSEQRHGSQNVIADLKAGKEVYASLPQQQKDSLVKILQWKAGDRQ